ncbi:winged helix-turn-helix domain-containing protein [Alphaproteobacteria bacterium]|nr:winged helix-turn-helix domain-containing protein [Alphaproteobacteria bacterium]
MQKKFVIIENDKLLNDLIVQQMPIVFENYFNIKFLKSYNINVVSEFNTIDLTIVNFKFIKDDSNILLDLENRKKSKIIIVYDNQVERSQLKKYSNYNFVVKPFKLNQMIDIIRDFFISYETHQKNIKITNNLIFRPETKLLLNKKSNVIINLTEKESRLLNFILENKDNVLKKDEILIKVWGITERINTHTLETHIYSLKKKLNTFDYNHSFICSDNLGGYYFNELKT